jgi:hypothetical protein
MISPASAEDLPKADTHPTRQTWEQHFAQANTAHDGHLTLEEAKGGFGLVAKHFDDIDVDHKGYVTENDIRAWRAMRKAAHRLTQPPAERPVDLVQRHRFCSLHPFSANRSHCVCVAEQRAAHSDRLGSTVKYRA